jgi:DNA-binding Lrp family transcriptional regulator
MMTITAPSAESPQVFYEEETFAMMRAYVLIESVVGKANTVSEGVRKLKFADTDVVSVDAVTGPFDVIALLESDDLDRLGRAITDGIQQVEGVQRTTTCLVVRLG